MARAGAERHTTARDILATIEIGDEDCDVDIPLNTRYHGRERSGPRIQGCSVEDVETLN